MLGWMLAGMRAGMLPGMLASLLACMYDDMCAAVRRFAKSEKLTLNMSLTLAKMQPLIGAEKHTLSVSVGCTCNVAWTKIAAFVALFLIDSLCIVCVSVCVGVCAHHGSSVQGFPQSTCIS